MLRNAEHLVTLAPPGGATPRTVYATVATLTVEEREGTYNDYTLAAISVRIDDGGPVAPGWTVDVTTPALLAGNYEVKLVAPSRGHTRIVAEKAAL